eukprot:5837678-Prymnesium_polylepis.2
MRRVGAHTVASLVGAHDLKADVWWQQEFVLLRIEAEGTDIARHERFCKLQREHGARAVRSEKGLHDVCSFCHRREGCPLDLVACG